MTRSGRCHDGVIPLNDTNAVIDNRDVYNPLYISIQVVRNFNGEEVIDDVSSPTSSLICAGKLMHNCSVSISATSVE